MRYDDADGAPIDEIAKLSPDLILATNSGITKAEYAKLTKIAPVVAYPGGAVGHPVADLARDGRQGARSHDAGRGGRGRDRERRSTRPRRRTPSSQGKTLIFGYLATTDLSTVGIYAPEDPRVSFLRDFGMVDAPAVADAIKPGEFYGTVSAEQAADLDSDVFLTWVGDRQAT